MSRSHRWMSSFAMMLLLCLLSAQAAGQNGTVYGTVNDDQGKPARDVLVALDNLEIGYHKKTRTGANGGFKFREVPPAANYQVTAIVEQQVVSSRTVSLNVDDQREVWPALNIPPAEKPVEAPDATTIKATNAVIYGGVFDSKANPMVGAEVKLENESKSFSKTQITDAEGNYKFEEVPAGKRYRLTASKGGNAFDARYPIEAVADEETRIFPPLLVIPAQAVAVELVSTAISGVISGEQLQVLPLYNRNFLALGLLTPGTHEVEQGSDLAGASFSISGGRPNSNNFLLDGSDNVASSSGQAVPFQVNDSIQEFRVISSNATAEYGRNLGGVVSVLTRRGTRKIHGSAYGYFANDALNADGPLSVFNGTTFDKAAGYAGSPTLSNLGSGPQPNLGTYLKPSSYNEYVNIARNSGYCTNSITGPLLNPSNCVAANAGGNSFFNPSATLGSRDSFKYPFDSKQFGASSGGALVKDRLFIFGSYEGTRIDNPNPIFERVPSAFDKSFNPLNSPTSFTPFAPLPVRDMFSPVNPDYQLGQAVLSLFPASNVVGVPGALEFFQGQAPNFTHVHNVLMRADWTQSDRTSFSLHYVTQVLNQLHDDSLPMPSSAGGYPGNGAYRNAFNQNFAVVVTQSLGSSKINEVRIGLNRFSVDETAQDATFDARTLGVAGSNFPNAAMPTIFLNGLDPRYSGAYLGVDGAVGGWSEVTSSPNLCNGLPNCGVPLPRMAPTLDGLFPFARIGAPLNTPSARIDNTFAFSDNLSFARGKHDMKMGFSIRVLSNQIRNGAYQRGFVYSGNIGEFTHDSETCNQACTARANPGILFNSLPNSFRRPSFDFARFDNAPLAGNFRSLAPAVFLQDAWSIRSGITVNMGVRYEYSSPPYQPPGRTWNFDPNAGGLVPTTGNPTTVDPYGNPCGSKPLDRSTPQGGLSFPAVSWQNCLTTGNPTAVPSNARNFASRLGVAWDVFGNGKTVLRAGEGLFWDQLPANFNSQLIFNRPATVSNAQFGQLIDPQACATANTGIAPFSAANCGLGNSMVNPARRSQTDLNGILPNSFFTEATFPFAMYARDTANSGTPLAVQTNLSVQHQFTNNLALEVGYAGTIARRLPVVFNSRAAKEFDPDLTSTRPLVDRFPVFTMTNQGASNYHSLMARLRAAQWHGLRMNSTYVFSRSVDNASSSPYYTAPITLDAIALQESVRTGNAGSSCFAPTLRRLVVTANCTALPLPNFDFRGGALTTTGAAQILVTPYSFPQDSFNFLSDDRGRSDFDVTHRLVLDYTWEVPTLRKGAAWSKWTEHWILSGIFVAQSGQPFTIFSAPAAAVELTQRVNLVGSGPTFNMSDPNSAISSSGLSAAFLDCGSKVLLNPTTACTGNSRRNAFTGPSFINMDFALQKGIPVQGEGKMLTIRAELYNLFDRANYYNPISKFSSDGVNLNPEFGKIKSAHDPRRAQFAVRFTW